MKNVFNLPNILSMFRIVLIPVFVVLYFSHDVAHHYLWAMITVIVAALTDVVDGYIARRFNLITAVGKILDPMADKMMQAAVLVCLAFTHPLVVPMAAIHFVKEMTMLIGGLWFFRQQNQPYSSRWWGKLSTVIIIVTLVLIIFSDVADYVPNVLVIVGIVASICSMIFAFISYVLYALELKKSLSVEEVKIK